MWVFQSLCIYLNASTVFAGDIVTMATLLMYIDTLAMLYSLDCIWNISQLNLGRFSRFFIEHFIVPNSIYFKISWKLWFSNFIKSLFYNKIFFKSIGIRCPIISYVEVHPFTVSSTLCDEVSNCEIFIKLCGDWTSKNFFIV